MGVEERERYTLLTHTNKMMPTLKHWNVRVINIQKKKNMYMYVPFGIEKERSGENHWEREKDGTRNKWMKQLARKTDQLGSNNW